MSWSFLGRKCGVCGRRSHKLVPAALGAYVDLRAMVCNVCSQPAKSDAKPRVRALALEFEDPRDGRKYKLVNIGGQVWFAENLSYIPHVSSCNQDGGVWVNGYNWRDVSAARKVDNYKEYGCLYDFRSAQLLCPVGWRLPTRLDFKNLLLLAGGSEYSDRAKVYKSLGPRGTLGFNSLIAGGRRPSSGQRGASFTPPGEYSDWWSCERADDHKHGLFDQNEALGHTLHFQTDSFSGHFFPDAAPLTWGLSVRCIKK